MKTSFKKFYACIIAGIITILISNCSSDDSKSKSIVEEDRITTKHGIGNSFEYKIFLNEGIETFKGLVILAHGDGGNMHDATLNAQCEMLAKKGYIALTTTYRLYNGNLYSEYLKSFKTDVEQIISAETATYGVPRNKVIIGGLSRGGNLSLGIVLPGQIPNEQPLQGIGGVILMCAGGDQWKGSAILYPTLFMSNENDNAVGTNASAFKLGLQDNMNPNVKDKSKCLIIPDDGHCTGQAQYKDFIAQHIDQLL